MASPTVSSDLCLHEKCHFRRLPSSICIPEFLSREVATLLWRPFSPRFFHKTPSPPPLDDARLTRSTSRPWPQTCRRGASAAHSPGRRLQSFLTLTSPVRWLLWGSQVFFFTCSMGWHCISIIHSFTHTVCVVICRTVLML